VQAASVAGLLLRQAWPPAQTAGEFIRPIDRQFGVDAATSKSPKINANRAASGQTE
jgi:hypothetical protein